MGVGAFSVGKRCLSEASSFPRRKRPPPLCQTPKSAQRLQIIHQKLQIRPPTKSICIRFVNHSSASPGVVRHFRPGVEGDAIDDGAALFRLEYQLQVVLANDALADHTEVAVKQGLREMLPPGTGTL